MFETQNFTSFYDMQNAEIDGINSKGSHKKKQKKRRALSKKGGVSEKDQIWNS